MTQCGKRCYTYTFPVGKCYIEEEAGMLTCMIMGQENLLENRGAIMEETPLLKEAARQLGEYFVGKRTTFDLPQNPEGTPFQKKVWQALRGIPYGETRSYGEIAKAVGCPGGARAVGMACNRNPIFIATPCHRVIGANGALVGFGGGLELKKFLLKLEQK